MPFLKSIHHSQFTIHRKAAGYTLIELIVVITILAILTAFGTYTFENAQQKSRDSKRKENLKDIKTALVSYYTDHGQYPPSCNPLPCSQSAQFISQTGGNNWIPELSDYIPVLPKDPKQAGLPVFLALKDFLTNVFTKTVTPTVVYADTAGPRNPTLGESVTAGCSYAQATWSSPNNILSSNNSRASALLPVSGNNISHCLRATGFGFSIPAASTINGIVAQIEKKASLNTQVRDYTVKIVKGGVAQGTNKRDHSVNSGYWSTTDTVVSYGSSTDLWGVTWTPNDINASNFGVQVQAALYETADTTAYVDHIKITVYYTLGLPPTPTPTPLPLPSPSPSVLPSPSPSAAPSIAPSPPPPSGNCDNATYVYCYIVAADRQTFVLWAQLENQKDRQLIGKPDSPCPSPPPTPPSASLNYCLTNPN